MENQLPDKTPHALQFIPSAVLLLTLIAAFLLTSCNAALTPSVKPPVDAPGAFSESGRTALPDKWWLSLNDPRLDELIEDALRENLDLLAVWDRLAQAEAVVKREGAPLLPVIEADARASVSKRGGDGDGLTGNSRSSERSEISLGLVAGYEIDLWGRVRSLRDAARFDLDASREDVQATAITLSAEVALVWYEIAAAYGQLQLLDEQTQTNSQILELVTLRFRRGQVGAADVIRQRQLVESLKGRTAEAESVAKTLEYKLALLLGKPPRTAIFSSPPELVEIPALPATGIPAEFLQHRPDVKRAYLGLLAQDRRAAAAVADRFPRLSIAAEAGLSGEGLRDLFDNWVANLAANLLAPLFDGGARKAEASRQRAAVSEAIRLYGRSVLMALGEVERALVQERKQRELVESFGRQLKLSEQVLARERESYVKGAADYLRVLDALLAHQELQRQHLDAGFRLAGFRISLCRALAGGWEMPRPPLVTISGESEATENSDNLQ